MTRLGSQREYGHRPTRPSRSVSKDHEQLAQVRNRKHRNLPDGARIYAPTQASRGPCEQGAEKGRSAASECSIVTAGDSTETTLPASVPHSSAFLSLHLNLFEPASTFPAACQSRTSPPPGGWLVHGLPARLPARPGIDVAGSKRPINTAIATRSARRTTRASLPSGTGRIVGHSGA